MNKYFNLWFLVFTVCVSWADTLLVSDTVEVTAERTREQTLMLSEESSYRKVTITSSLERNNLSRVLAKSPGITAQKSGGVGSFQTVAIRGTEGKRVAVYLNGVPQMSSLGGAVDLSRFSGLNITAVEVYRGFSPAKLGGNSLGGVINIITDSIQQTKEFSFLAGSFGEIEGRAILQAQHNDWNYGGTLTYHGAKNNYPFWSRNGTPHNESDDFTDTMQNNAFHAVTAQTYFEKKLKESQNLQFSATYEQQSRELPSHEGDDHNQTAKWTEKGFKLYGNYSKRFLSGVLFTDAMTLSASEGEVQWSDLDFFRVFFGNPQKGELAKLRSKSFTIENTPSLSLFIGDKLLNENRADIIYERVTPETNQDGFGIGDWESDYLRGKLCSDFRYYGNWGNLIAGGTFEVAYSRNEGGENSHFTFELPPMKDTAIAWAVQGGCNLPLADEKILLFSNVGRFSRLPSVQERFGFHGGILPNPTIKPESGLNSEVGFSFKGDKLTLESILFYNKHKELITFIFNGVTGRSENVSKSRVYGLEQTLLFNPLSWLDLETNLTWQKSRNEDPRYKDANPDEEYPLLPDQPALSILSTLSLGSFKGISLSPTIEYKSIFYRDLANGKPVPTDTTKVGTVHLSSTLTYEKESFCLELQFLDILDNKKDKSNESGYYTLLYPGRSIQGKFSIKF